ncbi:MAG: PAS domain-containing protein [Terriglobales bacterium]|jgi:PAS domain S-box-containing protein
MFSNLVENPKLFRHLAEDLPVGIYIVDRERRICFWNHGAERITGRLSHDVVGHVVDDAMQVCDRRGNSLRGEHCPVSMTLNLRKPQRCTAFSLHKNGHRTAVRIHTQPILEYGNAIGGATVMFEEVFAHREESSGSTMYGCLDTNTGIPSRRLTRAVLSECMAALEQSHIGFGLLRIRLLGMDDVRAQHGPQAVAPFLRTAANTLRHSLEAENFVGCWDENEFLVVLISASPMMVAMTGEVLCNLLNHSEVSWWGDRFPIAAEAAYTVATAGTGLETLLREMKPSHPMGTTKAVAAGAGDHAGRLRG